ncbi:MAG TPA: hypothetical protein VET48_12675 [Steroidobacteraceae bacterium]|nr:hypothetical protein [Steroidobacteraceae bacterium]
MAQAPAVQHPAESALLFLLSLFKGGPHRDEAQAHIDAINATHKPVPVPPDAETVHNPEGIS